MPMVSGTNSKPVSEGEASRTTSRNTGMNVMSDTKAAPWQAAMASLCQICGRRRSFKGISGDAARFSCLTSSTSAIRPTSSKAPPAGSCAELAC
jgi:hypothetical protein